MGFSGINYLTGDDTVEPMGWSHFAAILMCGDAENDSPDPVHGRILHL